MIEKQKESKGYYVKVSNQWFDLNSDDNNLSLVYGERGFVLLVRMLQQLTRGEYAITDHHIQEWFRYTNKQSRRSIYTLLDHFKHDEIFLFNDDYDFTKVYRGIIRYQLTSTTSPASGYFEVYDEEIDAILLDDSLNVDKYKLLLLFAGLKRYYNTDTKICNSPSIETLSTNTGLSQNTILSYIDVLVDVGLILYSNPGTKLFPDGTVRECNNIYTMNYTGNKDMLEQEVGRMREELLEQEERRQLKVINKKWGAAKASVKMKLHWLPIKLDSGKITQEEYDNQYNELQEEYARLSDQQKSIHNHIK